MLDSRRAVADDVIELLLQLLEHAVDALAPERVLVAGLRSWKDKQVVVALILDQRLVEVGVAIDDVDEIEHHAALAPHDQVEVAQAHIEIDDHGLVPTQREAGGKGGGRRGLADPALARCDHDDLRQNSSLAAFSPTGGP